MEPRRPRGLGGYGRGLAFRFETSDVMLGTNARNATPRVMTDALLLKKIFPPISNLRQSMAIHEHEVKVTCWNSPNYVCFQTLPQTKWIGKQEQEIHTAVLDGGDSLKIYPSIDYRRQPCAVFHNNLWRRGFIFSTNWRSTKTKSEDRTADVTLIDYGIRGPMPMENLKKLPPKLLGIAPMAYRARLEGDWIEGMEENWPEDVLKSFEEIINGANCIYCKLTTADEAPEIILRDPTHSCSLCKKRPCTINELMERILKEKQK